MGIKVIDPNIEAFVKNHALYKSEYAKFLSNTPSSLSKAYRLDIVFNICEAMESAANGEYAKLQLDTTLNVVEDSFSMVSYAPSGTFNDGRMYPAQEDYRRRTPFYNIATYEHRSHFSHFGQNGAIYIETRDGRALFDKVGADMLTVGELRELSSPKISSSGS